MCADQAGHGAGILLSGSTPSPASSVNQVLDPIYEWDDTASVLGGGGNVQTTDSGQTIANRDWYTDSSNGTPQAQTSPTSPFNGTSGVGFGTTANRPSTCTPMSVTGLRTREAGIKAETGLEVACSMSARLRIRGRAITRPIPIRIRSRREQRQVFLRLRRGSRQLRSSWPRAGYRAWRAG